MGIAAVTGGGCFCNRFIAGLAQISYKSKNFFADRKQPLLILAEAPLSIDADHAANDQAGAPEGTGTRDVPVAVGDFSFHGETVASIGSMVQGGGVSVPSGARGVRGGVLAEAGTTMSVCGSASAADRGGGLRSRGTGDSRIAPTMAWGCRGPGSCLRGKPYGGGVMRGLLVMKGPSTGSGRTESESAPTTGSRRCVGGGDAPRRAPLDSCLRRNDACRRPPLSALRTGFDRRRANGIANRPCNGGWAFVGLRANGTANCA